MNSMMLQADFCFFHFLLLFMCNIFSSYVLNFFFFTINREGEFSPTSCKTFCFSFNLWYSIVVWQRLAYNVWHL